MVFNSLIETLRSRKKDEWGQPHEQDTPSLEVMDVSVRYENRYAIREVSFRLIPGERVAVVGPNGAGKSTLFKVISGVMEPTTGKVSVYGHYPGSHLCIAYVPQRNQVDWSFPVNVSDVVMMGRIGKMGYLRHKAARDEDYVKQCLEVVGITNLSERQIGELSGGQQQRMFIARALAQEAELVLMDEPLSGLDLPTHEDIFRILDELKARGVTVMVATHDLDMAVERFDRSMLLNRVLLGFGKPEQVFTTENLVRAYGRHVRVVDSEEGQIMVVDTCCDDGELEDG
jgi:manganese/iron transport system ATP-binding protein